MGCHGLPRAPTSNLSAPHMGYHRLQCGLPRDVKACDADSQADSNKDVTACHVGPHAGSHGMSHGLSRGLPRGRARGNQINLEPTGEPAGAPRDPWEPMGTHGNRGKSPRQPAWYLGEAHGRDDVRPRLEPHGSPWKSVRERVGFSTLTGRTVEHRGSPPEPTGYRGSPRWGTQDDVGPTWDRVQAGERPRAFAWAPAGVLNVGVMNDPVRFIFKYVSKVLTKVLISFRSPRGGTCGVHPIRCARKNSRGTSSWKSRAGNSRGIPSEAPRGPAASRGILWHPVGILGLP